MKSHFQRKFAAPALVVASLLALTACGQANDERTAGQKVDSAIATADKKTDAIASDIKTGTTNAVDTAAANTQDAAITTQVNAELARDPELSALKIDVDTKNGHVVLKGTAPSETAKERAVTMARAVSGVVQVESQLRIGG